MSAFGYHISSSVSEGIARRSKIDQKCFPGKGMIKLCQTTNKSSVGKYSACKKSSNIILCDNSAAETGCKYCNLNCEKLGEEIATLESNMITSGKGKDQTFFDMINGEHAVDMKAILEEELLNAAVSLEQ